MRNMSTEPDFIFLIADTGPFLYFTVKSHQAMATFGPGNQNLPVVPYSHKYWAVPNDRIMAIFGQVVGKNET